MSKILVSDPIAEEGIAHLRTIAEVDVRTGLPHEELKAIIGNYDALAVRSETKVTKEILESAARLQIIGRAGVGVDNIDVKVATERGIIVVNSPEGNTIAAAELTVAMLLSLARMIPQADASLRAGRWDRKKYVGTEVFNKTLGVIGLGKIGAEVAKRARAFGMNIVAFDPFATEEKAAEAGAVLASLEDLYRASDFITLHLPLNDSTRGMIGREQLAIMKQGVRIVNCARGGIIDETALAEAIASGHVAGAAIDVFAQEPVDFGNTLLALNQTVVTPHLGASTAEAQVNVAIDISEQIVDVLQGRPARAAVNIPAISKEALIQAQPYLTLGEKIGSLQTQLARELDDTGRPIEAIEVLFQGDFGDMPKNPVTRAVLAGILGPMLSDPVNLVNAPVLAAARGLKVTESASSSSPEYNEMLTVKAQFPHGSRTICGTVFGKNDIRIVHIDSFHVDVTPQGYLVFTQHTDRPGIIGRVGTLLGERGINIAGMNVGREQIGGKALMALTVDEQISPDTMAQIRAIDGMETARLVSL